MWRVNLQVDLRLPDTVAARIIRVMYLVWVLFTNCVFVCTRGHCFGSVLGIVCWSLCASVVLQRGCPIFLVWSLRDQSGSSHNHVFVIDLVVVVWWMLESFSFWISCVCVCVCLSGCMCVYVCACLYVCSSVQILMFCCDAKCVCVCGREIIVNGPCLFGTRCVCMCVFYENNEPAGTAII